MKTILPPSTIGIIGGGQLGKMMSVEAKKMGYKVCVLDPDKNCPAGQVSDNLIVNAYTNQQSLLELGQKCDVVTYEFENISTQSIHFLQSAGFNVVQGSQPLSLTQDRGIEKNAIKKNGFKCVDFEIIEHADLLENAIAKIGLPAILKTTTNGYDGKGQVFIKTQKDIVKAKILCQTTVCILEAFLPFEKELSILVFRSPKGETSFLPLTENVHFEGILHQSFVPANVSLAIEKTALEIAQTIVLNENIIGTLAIEFFLYKNELYINEMAPRPHNSGHHSIESCTYSQFEQHIRAICNLPLLNVQLKSKSVMTNILGQHVEASLQALEKSSIFTTYFHLYGKDEIIENRKMGHWTLLGEDIERMCIEGKRLIGLQ